jgi:hypothetical protein
VFFAFKKCNYSGIGSPKDVVVNLKFFENQHTEVCNSKVSVKPNSPDVETSGYIKKQLRSLFLCLLFSRKAASL